MNYYELNELIKNTYTNTPLVEMVLENSNLINNKGTMYWCIAYDLVLATRYETYTEYQFNIYACERMDDAQLDIVQHYSKGIEIIMTGLETINETVDVQYPINFQMNSIKFADVLDVVMATVNIQVENTVDCE